MKNFELLLSSGRVRIAYDTIENVKKFPDALAIREFSESEKDYVPLMEKRDGVWVNSGSQSIYS